MFDVFHSVLTVHCSLVLTCWERAGPLALLWAVFSCVFVTFPCGVLGQVWYFIVLIPDICLLPYFDSVIRMFYHFTKEITTYCCQYLILSSSHFNKSAKSDIFHCIPLSNHLLICYNRCLFSSLWTFLDKYFDNLQIVINKVTLATVTLLVIYMYN